MSESSSNDEEVVRLSKKDLDDLLERNELLLERCSQLIQRNRDLKEKITGLERGLPKIRIKRSKPYGIKLRRYLSTIFSFSYRNLMRRRWRTTLTVLSLIATITGFMCTVNISQSIGFDLTSGEAERSLFAGIDVGYPYFSDVLITAEHPWWHNLPIGEYFRGPSSLVPEDLLARVRVIPGVEWAGPYVGDVKIHFQGASVSGEPVFKEWMIEHENGSIDVFSSDILMAGVDPNIESKRLGRKRLFVQGRAVQDVGLEVMVGYNFARSHNLTVGDTLIIPAVKHSVTHDSPGKLRERQFRNIWQSFWAWSEDRWQERFRFSIDQEVRMRIVGVFWTTTPYDDFVITTYNNLQGILGFGEKVTCILAKLNPEAEVDQTLNALWSLQDVNIYIPLLRKRYTTGQDQISSAFSSIAPTRFITVANLQNIVISEISAGIFIAAVVYTQVLERRWEIGLLKSLGFGATFILSTLMLEALILGLFAGIIGFIVSSLLSLLSSGILLPTGHFVPLLSSILPKIELKLTLEWGMTAIGLSSATSLVSSFVPAYLAAMLTPIEAMRRG